MLGESQAHLLGRIAAQDRQALAELYDQISSILFATSLRILGDTHEAQEVIQDVFMQIWNKAGVFNAELGSPIHWALGITRNRSIDRLRSRQRRGRLIEELKSAAVNDPTLEAVPEHNLLGAEEIAGVRSAVKALPLEQRQAIELAFFRGLTHAEIAENLKEPLGTVKARIRRGMLKLRDELKSYL